jgi:hypothetical protein
VVLGPVSRFGVPGIEVLCIVDAVSSVDIVVVGGEVVGMRGSVSMSAEITM